MQEGRVVHCDWRLGLVEEGGICETWACCSGGYLFIRMARI